MKKVIFALAAVVALAACSQEDVIIADKGAAIGFDTFVENSTRSKYDPSYTNSNLFANFGVFGTVEGAKLFNNKTVTGSENNGTWTWTYEGTQYWIAGAKYNFAAVAPKTVKVDGVDKNVYTVDDAAYTIETTKDADGKNVYTGTTTLSFVNDGTIDLLYAEAKAEGAVSGNQAVKFNFRHVLSKVKFSFENAYNASNATIRVKDVKILDAYASGVATLNANTAWTPANPSLKLAFGNAAVESATAEEAFGNGTTVESYNELLMIPGQGATAFEIKNADNSITPAKGYTIQFTVELLVSTKEVAEYTHTINTAFIPEAGKSYDLKATIKPENIDPAHAQEAIEFTVNKIGDWDEDHDGKENTEAGDTDGDTQVDTNLPLN